MNKGILSQQITDLESKLAEQLTATHSKELITYLSY